MQLYINNDLIDFTIEQEKTLIEIVEGLDRNFKKAQGHILSIAINGELITEENTTWQHTPIEQVETLHIEAETKEIAHIKILQSVLEYLNVIEEASTTGAYPQGLVLEDVSHILQNIDFLCAGHQIEHKPLQILLTYIFNVINLFDIEKTKKLEPNKDVAIILHHVRAIVLFRIILLIESDKQCAKLNAHIKQFIELSYMKVPSFFINAQEDLAIQYIISANDVFLQWLYFLHNTPHGIAETEKKETWHTLNHSIHNAIKPFLEEQSAAMEIEDWITVGDLIEYEISPLLLQYIDDMSQFFPQEQ